MRSYWGDGNGLWRVMATQLGTLTNKSLKSPLTQANKNQCSAGRQEPFCNRREPGRRCWASNSKPRSKTARRWTLLVGEHTTNRATLSLKQLHQSQIRLLDATTNLQENQRTERLVKVSNRRTTSKIQSFKDNSTKG